LAVGFFDCLSAYVPAQVPDWAAYGGAPAARLAALQLHGRRPSIVKAGAKRRGEGSEATGGQAVFAAQSGSFFDVVHNGGLSNY